MKKTQLTLKNIFYRIPVLTGIFGFLIALFLGQLITLREYEIALDQEKEAVMDYTLVLENKIKGALNNAYAATSVLAFLHNRIDFEKEFATIAQELLDNNPNIDALQWNEMGIIKYIIPLEGNEDAIGFNILKDTITHKDIEANLAIEKNQMFFAGPFELKQGGMGIVGRLPVKKNGEFFAFSVAIIRLESFYNLIGYRPEEDNPYYVQFSKINPFSQKEENFLPQWTGSTGYTHLKKIEEGDWLLTVQLKESKAFDRIIFQLLLRLVLALVLGFVAYYLAKQPALLEMEVLKKAKKLRLTIRRFKMASEATSDAIWEWDLEHDKIYRSKSFAHLFGYSVEFFNKKQGIFDDLIHPEDRKRVKNNIQSFLQGKKTYWKEEFRFLKENGEYAYVMDKGVLLRGKDGKPKKMIGAVQDISLLKQKEIELIGMTEQLEERAKALEDSYVEMERFALKASTDLQHPTRMIVSFLDLLEKKYYEGLDQKGKKYADFIREGAIKIKLIALALLEYSEAGKELLTENVDLNKIVEEVEIIRKKKILDLGAQIIKPTLPMVKGSKNSSRQLFDHLINNCLIYSNPTTPPYIEVLYNDLGSFWEFEIRDNGIGIEQKFQKNIFNVFERLDNNVNEKSIGLGLSVCKKIVNKQGGKIWLESQPGKGTSIFFTWPKNI